MPNMGPSPTAWARWPNPAAPASPRRMKAMNTPTTRPRRSGGVTSTTSAVSAGYRSPCAAPARRPARARNGPAGKPRLRARRPRLEEHGGAGLERQRGDDDRPPPDGVREAAGHGPHAEGRARVGDREEPDPSNPEVEGVGREEREHHALAETEGRTKRHGKPGGGEDPAKQTWQTVARADPARLRWRVEPCRDPGSQEGEDRRGQEQPAEAGRLHEELAQRRAHSSRDEPRDPEDPERLAAPVRGRPGRPRP